jgi:hypothetical protein
MNSAWIYPLPDAAGLFSANNPPTNGVDLAIYKFNCAQTFAFSRAVFVPLQQCDRAP